MQATTITEETLRLLFGKMGTIWMFVVCALWSKDICEWTVELKAQRKKKSWVAFSCLSPKGNSYFKRYSVHFSSCGKCNP